MSFSFNKLFKKDETEGEPDRSGLQFGEPTTAQAPTDRPAAQQDIEGLAAQELFGGALNPDAGAAPPESAFPAAENPAAENPAAIPPTGAPPASPFQMAEAAPEASIAAEPPPLPAEPPLAAPPAAASVESPFMAAEPAAVPPVAPVEPAAPAPAGGLSPFTSAEPTMPAATQSPQAGIPLNPAASEENAGKGFLPIGSALPPSRESADPSAPEQNLQQPANIPNAQNPFEAPASGPVASPFEAVAPEPALPQSSDQAAPFEPTASLSPFAEAPAAAAAELPTAADPTPFPAEPEPPMGSLSPFGTDTAPSAFPPEVVNEPLAEPAPASPFEPVETSSFAMAEPLQPSEASPPLEAAPIDTPFAEAAPVPPAEVASSLDPASSFAAPSAFASEPGFETSASSQSNLPPIVSMPLASVLKNADATQLGFDPAQVPDSLMVNLPSAELAPGLAAGKVEVSLSTIVAGVDESTKAGFANSAPGMTVELPIDEVASELPMVSATPPTADPPPVFEEISPFAAAPEPSPVEKPDEPEFGVPFDSHTPRPEAEAAPVSDLEPAGDELKPSTAVGFGAAAAGVAAAGAAALSSPFGAKDEEAEPPQQASPSLGEAAPAFDEAAPTPFGEPEPPVEAVAPEEAPAKSLFGDVPEAAPAESEQMSPFADLAPPAAAPAEPAPLESLSPLSSLSPFEEQPDDSALETEALAPLDAAAGLAPLAPFPPTGTPAVADEEKEQAEALSLGEESTPSPFTGDFNDKPSVLRALLLTDGKLDEQAVLQHCAELPGIFECVALTEDGGVSASTAEGGALEAAAPSLLGGVRAAADALGVQSGPFTVRSPNGLISLFAGKRACLGVLHGDEGFKPGVQERLGLVAEELDVLNS